MYAIGENLLFATGQGPRCEEHLKIGPAKQWVSPMAYFEIGFDNNDNRCDADLFFTENGA